jgi:hypothetical protein
MHEKGRTVEKITRIEYKPEKKRYWIFVNGEYCCSIRERTFPALKLSVGLVVTCDEVKERENFFWKQQYGRPAWEKEGVRLTKVKTLIDSIDPRAEAQVVGFGAGSTGFIAEHPKEAGRPDIEVVTADGRRLVLLAVEVTGTEQMRGTTYWVRPDKLAYVQAHPEQEVWLILHYAEPQERFVFIRPSPKKAHYSVAEKVIRGATEYYVEFTDDSPEVVSLEAFRQNLVKKIDAASKG